MAELGADYDLMVIYHPHIGVVATEGCLLPLDRPAAPHDLLRLEGETVGKSYRSYTLAELQWALSIDPATQVQAIRPDLQPSCATR